MTGTSRGGDRQSIENPGHLKNNVVIRVLIFYFSWNFLNIYCVSLGLKEYSHVRWSISKINSLTKLLSHWISNQNLQRPIEQLKLFAFPQKLSKFKSENVQNPRNRENVDEHKANHEKTAIEMTKLENYWRNFEFQNSTNFHW